MAWVGRELKENLVPTPCHEQKEAVGDWAAFLHPFPEGSPCGFDSVLVSPHRCLLHCHLVVPVEGHCHHPGELPAPLRPQVPETEVFSPQLLEAHVLGLLLLAHRDRHCPGPRDTPSCPQWTVLSLPQGPVVISGTCCCGEALPDCPGRDPNTTRDCLEGGGSEFIQFLALLFYSAGVKCMELRWQWVSLAWFKVCGSCYLTLGFTFDNLKWIF